MSDSATPSKRRQTALAVIDAYNEWSIDAIMALRSDDCVQCILPKSLGRPEMTNEAYRAYFGAMIPLFTDFKVEIKDVFEDAAANKVVIWATSTASTPVGPYANEYTLMLYFNEDGSRVVRFNEFVDSANSVTFFPKLREYVAKQGK
ncbi:hypothetical protein F5Y18DRAFT_161562 [Xylariaceae sp. FL1019]|nr:hypothetical protein F5Y18DRAFT_161562 [Xylariaceae sp. FL1019]